ncbi:hypothetical protein B9Z55_025495 [Caenorhabditis nigoni]|nr:hypothetical protein B9Z55_025495 [Caenorhabditis nigoni]
MAEKTRLAQNELPVRTQNQFDHCTKISNQLATSIDQGPAASFRRLLSFCITMIDPPPGISQLPSNSGTQPMTTMEQLLQLRKTLDVCQSTGKSLIDEVDQKISIVRLTEDVEKLHGQMSSVSSEVNSINIRTGSMESVLEKLLENSNKTLENHSSLEATITKSNADVEAIKQHIQMFDSNNQEKYSRIEQAVITSAGDIEKINQRLEAFDSNKILEKQSSLEQAVINSTSVVQEIKQQLEAKSISDDADLRTLLETQNQKFEEHKNEIVTAINEISQNVEASQVNETLHSAIKQLQEKFEARSISSTRGSSDSVPEVVLPSTAVSPVENSSISKSDVSVGQHEESGEPREGDITPLASRIGGVPEGSQPTSPIKKNSVVVEPVVVGGKTEAGKPGVKRLRSSSIETDKSEKRSASLTSATIDSAPEAVGPSTVVSPVEIMTISTSDLSGDQQEESGEQGAGINPLTITVEVPEFSQPPTEKNSEVDEQVVVEVKPEVSKSGMKRPRSSSVETEKIDKRSASPTRVLADRVPASPEVVVQSTAVSSVESVPNSKPDVNAGPHQRSGEKSELQLTSLSTISEPVPEVLQPTPPIGKELAVGPTTAVSPINISPISTSDLGGGPQEKPEEQNEGGTTSLAMMSKAAFEVSPPKTPIKENSVIGELVVKEKTEQTKSGVKRQCSPSIENERKLSKFPKHDDTDNRIFPHDGDFDYDMDAQPEFRKSFEPEETTQGTSSNHSSSIRSTTRDQDQRALVDEEMVEAPTKDSSDNRTDELPLHQADNENDLDDLDDQHEELDATSEEEDDVQQEEDVIEMENGQDPERASKKNHVPLKKGKNNRKKAKRLTTTKKRAPKQVAVVEVFDMEKHNFEWGTIRNNVAKEYQEDDGTNKIDVFVGKTAEFWENPDEVKKQLVAQSAAYTANGMVRFACEESKWTFADEKQRENVSAFLNSHTSAIDPCYLRTTVDPDTYNAIDSDDFRYCREYLRQHNLQQEEPVPMRKESRRGGTTFPQLPTIAINHQPFNLPSAGVIALLDAHPGYNPIYSPMEIKNLEPNRELVAAEQEQFKNDIPEAAREKNRLPAIHVEIKSKEDLHSPNLKKVLDSSPITVLSGVGRALGIDLKTLTSQRVAATVPNLIVDVMMQVAQPVDQNITLEGMKEWGTQRKDCKMTLERFEKWKKNEQKACRKLLNMLKKCDPKHAAAMAQDFLEKRIKAPYPFEGVETNYSWTPFATNIDLTKDAENSKDLEENQDHFKEQKDILDQLPWFMQATDQGNLLAHIRENVFGVNTVQMYSKFIGSLTAAHMENSLMASINWNIGPASCVWYAIPYEYWTQLEKLVKEKGQTYHHQNYWPSEEDIREAEIPLIKFEQKEDELVYVNTGTFHWVQAEGYCTNVSWNVGPANFNQLAVSLISAAHDTASKYQCHVPITNVIWNAAEQKMFMNDPAMYKCMRWHMQRSITWCKQYIAWIGYMRYDLEDWTHRAVEYIYRCHTCNQEVFNICRVHREGKDESKDKIFCSKCSRKPGKNKRLLFVIYRNIEKLSQIYDDFFQEIPEEENQREQ